MSALGGIQTALKTAIGTDAPTAALLAAEPVVGVGVSGKGVYDEGGAPQPTQAKPMSVISPYVTVGAGTEIPLSALARRGWNCTVQLKVVAQGPESVGQAIVSALSALLFPASGKYLTVPGFGTVGVTEFSVPTVLVETISGIVTRSWPVIVRVQAA